MKAFASADEAANTPGQVTAGKTRMVLLGALGMAGPVVAGLLTGHTDAGLSVGLGALLLAAAPTGGNDAARSPTPGPLLIIGPALGAVLAATAIAGHAWSGAALVVWAGMAALGSGYSRELGGAAMRFIVYLVLSAGFVDGAPGHHGAAALVFGSGAIWNIVLRAMLGVRTPAGQQGQSTRRVPTTAQRRAHFRNTLRGLEGWQFTLRLVLGLSVGTALSDGWPGHHFHWIVLTVALLTQRPVERLPRKTIDRLAGTAGGVLVGAVTLVVTSTAALAAFACVLAGLLPIARARSYLLYSVVATPLILLVLDLRQRIGLAMLTDRLIATLIGGIVVIALNVAFQHLLRTSPSSEGAGRMLAGKSS